MTLRKCLAWRKIVRSIEAFVTGVIHGGSLIVSLKIVFKAGLLL